MNAGKLQILTVAAMLVLVSGGIAAYAQSQSASPAGGVPIALAGSDANSTTSTNSTSTSTSSTTSTTSKTSTTSANQTLCQPTSPVNVGRLTLPITAVGSSTGSSLSFSNGRGCVASITTVGGIFSVQILLRYAKPVTQYNVVLLANGTSYTLGNMVTGPAGNGQMQNQVLLKPGTYVVSIQIYDTSSSPGHSTLVLQTGQGTITSPPFPAANSGNSTNGGQQPFPGSPQGGHGQSGHHK